jgi:hypothetical protein
MTATEPLASAALRHHGLMDNEDLHVSQMLSGALCVPNDHGSRRYQIAHACTYNLLVRSQTHWIM